MNPRQKPQEDVVGRLRDAACNVARARANGVAECLAGWEQTAMLEAANALEQGKSAVERVRLAAYEAGRRDMREAAGRFVTLLSAVCDMQKQNLGDPSQTYTDLEDLCADIQRALPPEPLGGEG